MNIEIFAAFISSTVVAALILSAFSWFQSNKKNSLERITDERKNWRIDMRDYAEQFRNEDDFNHCLKILANIKLRINAFGIVDYSNYSCDGHIWEFIDNFESSQGKTREEQLKIKNRVIESISCLLKFDWERTKREIQGNGYKIVSIVTGIVTASITIVVAFVSDFSPLKFGIQILLCLIVILLLSVTFLHNISIFDEQIEIDPRKTKKIQVFLRVKLSAILMNIIFFTAWNRLLVYLESSMTGYGSGILIFCTISEFIISLAIVFCCLNIVLHQNQKIKDLLRYYKTIERIKNNPDR